MLYFLNVICVELNVIKVVGGWKVIFYRIFREINFCIGILIGLDRYGNKYFENNSYFMVRNCFVVYFYVDCFIFDGS